MSNVESPIILPGVLDTQLPAVVLATVQGVNGVLGVIPDIKYN